ncbi:S-adenosyl-methyltransferase MraW [Aphanomyces invadans]|uniref:S-adenosyl-methyltransferase MraW n=1 Tax=Aphanomyces invadans TaxID=157072 RepID=A0A024TC84_9STRA|nr:S-adenosyl-methyltransferase MraW [Aphanomyces invadans]ETV91770.1 S-adenosyl-methyltransferase MraW [Aphanomyces invadans]|eukprot:XP_008879696.1 S-adenosyl-methyltransferase MraW [Aphanomyces invadans]
MWAPRCVDSGRNVRYFVDGTVGLGGHSKLLLEQSSSARLLCIDRDPEILEQASRLLAPYSDRVVFAHGSYMDIKSHLAQAGFPDVVQGILVDLGVNSHHLDAGKRGFSIYHDGPLDMRFDPSTTTPTASDLVNTLSEAALIKIFTQYGEEPLAKEFAKAIIRRREGHPFTRTNELKRCIEAIADKWKTRKPTKGKKTIHPATRIFQALRISVNSELDHLQKGMPAFLDCLAIDGQLATIAFHSLEDRWIKRFFRDIIDDTEAFELVVRKAVQATDDEVTANPRSRSAKLRGIRRIAPPDLA